jgi:hypothetical protein
VFAAGPRRVETRARGGTPLQQEETMPTVEDRYVAATGYVRRTVGAVERQPIGFFARPGGRVEWYAGRDLAAPFSAELRRIEGAWLLAPSDEAREHAVRQVEALALRAIEALPPIGCTRDAGLIEIQSPGNIKAEMATTASVIRQLDADIAASAVDGAFKSAWRNFVDEWERFRKEHGDWLDRLWYSTYEKTIEYRRRALTWRNKFVAAGGVPSSPTDAPPSTAGEQVGATLDKLVRVVGWGGALYAAYKVISTLTRKSADTRRNARHALNAELARIAEDAEDAEEEPWMFFDPREAGFAYRLSTAGAAVA